MMTHSLKTYLFFICLSTLFSHTGLAQNGSKFGPSIAPTLANISHQGGNVKQRHPSFISSLNLGWTKGDHFSYRLGLGYSYLKSEKYGDEGAFYGDGISYLYTHKEIILPFDVYYAFREQKYNHLFLNTGLALSIALRKKAYETDHYLNLQPPFKKEISNSLDNIPVEVFAGVGLGYAFHVHSKTSAYLNLNLRSNAISKLLALFSYLFTDRLEERDFPPSVRTIGIDMGVWLK